MSNVGAHAVEDLIETSELLRRVGCTRNQLTRLRRAYALIRPVRSVGHGLLLWSSSLVETVRSILEQEAQR